MYRLDRQRDMRRWVRLARLIAHQLGSPHDGRVHLKKNRTLFLLLRVADFAAISDTLHTLNVDIDLSAVLIYTIAQYNFYKAVTVEPLRACGVVCILLAAPEILAITRRLG